MRRREFYDTPGRRGGVAARSAGAAGGDAGDRASQQLDTELQAERLASFQQGLKKLASLWAKMSRLIISRRKV